MKYKAKECRCWVEYPNEAYKKRNGEWKCIDQYKCVLQGDRWKKKTRCVLKEGAEDDRIRESIITYQDKSGLVGGTGSRTGTIARAEQRLGRNDRTV